MNILPLVFGFIILFAIGTYAFVHTLRATIQEKFHYSGALAVEREFADKVQSNNYKLQKGDSLDSQKATKSKKLKEKEFKSPRDNFNFKTTRKLNIKPLLRGQGDPALEKIALTLIKELYQTTSIYVPGMEHEILGALVRNIKQNPTLTSFEALLPKLTSENYPLYYKLTKGTQQYELKTNLGYPALSDFLTFDPKSHKKPVHFGSAARPVLEALFGREVTEQIIAHERHKWEIDHKHSPLSKKELEALLMQLKKNPSDYDSMLEFSTTRSKRSQEIIKDDATKLQIRINP